tara:strand:+ start:311 stop:877 length:567 start_codon:yes stop_codon:yes gene_type:complete
MNKNINRENSQNLIENLEDTHVIKTMFIEHQHILSVLDRLEVIGKQLLGKKKSIYIDSLIEADHLIDRIISIEPHHAREELALFPAIESKGIMGPSHCMREEHNIMREMKHNLKKDLTNINSSSREETTKISMNILKLCNILKDHIHKENTILYPLALELISEVEWRKIKSRCDEIGYCCVSPLELKI